MHVCVCTYLGVGEPDGQLLPVHKERLVEHDVHELLVLLHLVEWHGNDGAVGVVRERLDERCLARAGGAMQQQPQLVWVSLYDRDKVGAVGGV